MSKPLSSPISAPEIVADCWFNTAKPLSLAELRGRPVLLHAFQMLCPGCVSHGTPQAEKVHRLFGGTDLQVIGLHSVFEHRAAMTPLALEAFIHEYRLTMPIAVDAHGEDFADDDTIGNEAAGGALPVTMSRYRMRGTPTSFLIGRDGTILHHAFGQQDDMALGALIASALAGEVGNAVSSVPAEAATKTCDARGCALPG
jgi:peroxiredoxin